MILSASPALRQRDRSGLRGASVETFWPGVAPASYYTEGAQLAARVGYSVPIAAIPTSSNAIVVYANQDGTLGTVTAWQMWPVQLDAPDTAFNAPDQTTWGNYLARIGIQNQANAAAEAATMQGEYGDTSGTQTAGGSTSATSCDASSFSLAGYCIPYWGLAAAAAALLFASHRKGKH